MTQNNFKDSGIVAREKEAWVVVGTKFFAKTDFPRRQVYVPERERKT